MAAEIYNLLYQLGVTANYTGFFYTAYAVSLCAEQPDRLLLVTKWLYPEVARQYKTTWKAVEHLAHRNLDKKPRTTQMLAILASSLNSSRLAAQELDEPAAVQEDDPLPQLQAGSDGPSSVPIA